MTSAAEFPVPYLPSLGWYRDYMAFRLGTTSDPPRLPRHFCRAEIVAPFGRQCLSVPVEGGRRLIAPRRYPQLILSEHGNWRHTHWNTIESAYGATPYFHFYKALFADIYGRRHDTLVELCSELNRAIDQSLSLSEIAEWLKAHPDAPIRGTASADADPSLSILDLLFRNGPTTIFTLLPAGYLLAKLC